MTKVTAKMVLAACDAYRKSAERKPVNGSFAEDMERALVAALSSEAPPIVAAGEPEAALSATDTQIIQPSHDDEGLIERLHMRLGPPGRGATDDELLMTQAANTISRLKGELDLVAGQLRYVAKSNAVNFDRSLLLEAEVEELRSAVGDIVNLTIGSGDPAHFRVFSIEDQAGIAALQRLRALLSPRLVGVEGDEVIPGSSDAKVSAPLPCRPEGQHSAGGEGS